MSKRKILNTTIEALKLNDKQAFEDLYVAYYENLCVYLLNYTNDKKIIEDIVQDTFVSVWSKRHEIGITDSIKSYLYRAVYNKLIDTFRKTKQTDIMLSQYYHTALMRAVEIDKNHSDKRLKKLDKCIEELPSRCKNVFIASKISGIRQQQVATDFDISLKTVEGHIARAFKLLKECMNVNVNPILQK